MGNRLTRIYTRTGDDGTTGLANGTRLEKTDARIEAIGAVDELNSTLGLALAASALGAALRDQLRRLQHRLFDLGADLALPGQDTLGDEHVAALERAIDDMNAGLPPLKEFILPGGGDAAARLHVARATCRRAERCVLALGDTAPRGGARYLNRLSDWLFVAARICARLDGGEVYWRRD
ncbi:MAG: cob(I)yrinic acid a,c-diamide adenosyltransferase [Chromatiales bacterium]|nr:cob(I)yrinic acid a,c-diamide adenosyltransferase [Chromatiales bacterium]